MRFKDIFLAILILILFLALYIFSILSVGFKKIRKDWPEYRCNPMVMPFASYFGHSAAETFTSCIATTMSGMMGFFLSPIHFIMSMLGGLGGTITSAMNEIRELQNFIRNGIMGIDGDIMGIFMNILIQFQRLIIDIKDLLAKTMGVTVVIMDLISGAMLTGQSIWAGPPGDILRALCFSQQTPIKLQNGKYKLIKNIHLGDILCNGSKVLGTLQLQGDRENPYYKLWSKELNDFIYVTGEHKILVAERDNFSNYIQISEYKEAIKTTLYDRELSCLITSNHRIPVGEHIFWDWED